MLQLDSGIRAVASKFTALALLLLLGGLAVLLLYAPGPQISELLFPGRSHRYFCTQTLRQPSWRTSPLRQQSDFKLTGQWYLKYWRTSYRGIWNATLSSGQALASSSEEVSRLSEPVVLPEIQQLTAQLTQHASESSALVHSTVIMTIVDTAGSKELLPVFLSSLCQANAQLAKQLLVICVSAEAYEVCSRTYATCMYDRAAEVRNGELAQQGGSEGKSRVKTPLFLQIGWDKLARLNLALQMNANIFFVDSDIVWLSDPMQALQSNPADIQATHDGWGPNIGVMFLRPTDSSLAFMGNWLRRRVAPDSRDQYEFSAAVNETSRSHPLHVAYMDKKLFPNGCCCWHSLPRARQEAQRCVLWHAACAGSLQQKRNSMQTIQRAALTLHPRHDDSCSL